MSTSRWRRGLKLSIFCLVVSSGCSRCGSPPAGDQGQAPAPAAAPAPESQPAAAPAAAKPDVPPTTIPAAPAAAVVEATVTAAQTACKAALKGLAEGDIKALDALGSAEREAILAESAAVRTLACLAIADDSARYCDILPDKRKKECVDHWTAVRQFKGVPREELKGRMLYQMCTSTAEKADCDVLKDAIAAKQAGKCAGMSQPPLRGYCEAVVTSDPKKCASMPEGPQRSYCAAIATDDPSQCPKDSEDCNALTKSFASLKTQGAESLAGIDPTLAAATGGKKVCASLATQLEPHCAPKAQ